MNPSGVETSIFWDNYINTMAANGLAPHVTRSSTAMVMTMQDKKVFVFYMERLQPHASSQELSNYGKCKFIFNVPQTEFSTSVN